MPRSGQPRIQLELRPMTADVAAVDHTAGATVKLDRQLHTLPVLPINGDVDAKASIGKERLRAELVIPKGVGFDQGTETYRCRLRRAGTGIRQGRIGLRAAET